MAARALACEAIDVSYGGVAALRNVSLELPRGKILSLVGKNGAGKTTLLDVLSGVRRPNGGRVVLDGADITGMRVQQRVRSGIARLYQYGTGVAGLTVTESVAMALPETRLQPVESRRSRQAREQRAGEFLSMVRFDGEPGRIVLEHSFGQQRRVAIASTLATGASVLLLDEPTAGLDPALVTEMAAVLIHLRELGKTILLVEHNLVFVEEVSDRVVLIDQGTILASMNPADVLKNPFVQSVYLG